MPSDAFENRIEDSLKAELDKIVGGASWLTTPTVKLGFPGDAVAPQANPSLYLQHLRTEPLPPEAGTAQHWMRASFTVWCVSTDPVNGRRTVAKLKADALRALYAAEGTLQAAYRFGLGIGSYAFEHEMSKAGVSAGRLEVFIDFEQTHTDI